MIVYIYIKKKSNKTVVSRLGSVHHSVVDQRGNVRSHHHVCRHNRATEEEIIVEK
jgi:hypothetical protein